MHVGQSTLSHQIRQLEQELGQALFERTKRRVALTVAGELFLPKALRALTELDAGVALLSSSPAELTGQLRIGTTQTFNVHVVPKAVAALIDRHPGVRVLMEQDKAAGMVQKRACKSAGVLGYAASISHSLST